MRRARRMRALAIALALVGGLAGCDSLPGKPVASAKPIPARDVEDFAVLYATNCSGCHGANGQFGAGPPLANPLYLQIAGADDLRRAIASGVPGTAMPAFAIAEGGALTDAQVDALVAGMRKHWGGGPRDQLTPPLPTYWQGADVAKGVAIPDARRGAIAYETHCSSCHGRGGRGGERGGSIVDPSYLALVSDQWLRTVVVAGRPDLGMPDWRGNMNGAPLTAMEMQDIVAWLSSLRPPAPGSAVASSTR
ncbi:MAG TPA: c-type cytochrome [Candidatus Binatia bacterium]|nr:c-type cytochrome [Candidatus Binatia bacterium]